MVLPALLLLCLIPPQDDMAEAMKLLEANQPAQAEPLFRKVIAADPADFTAHFNLAFALSAQQKDAEAIAEYRKTLELKPGIYQANLNAGMLCLRQKNPADALEFLQAACEAKPEELRPNLFYAEALLQTGDGEAAAQHYQTALNKEPNNATAQLGLARALLRSGKPQEAVPHYQAAAAANPAYKDAVLEAAQAFEKAGQSKEAASIYQQLPGNAAAQQRLGEILLESNEAAAAVPKLEQAVAANPSVSNLIALAAAYKRNKQPEKAAAQYALAVQSDPANFETRMMLGRELRDLHQLNPAAQQFLAAAQRQPDSVEAWNELAGVLIVAGNFEQGLAALDKVKALGKESPGNYYLRAITLDKLKQLKPALAAYQQFLEADKGKLPDEEFKARQRARIIQNELNKK